MTDASFPDHFSGHAAAYARHRPDYPDALFAFLADAAPGRDLAWDAGTGNGQAAVALAARFARVVATDPSAEQLRHATPHPRVEYRAEPAEAPSLADASADLVTAAQAAHWFRHDAFWPAVRRVLRPGGVAAVWAYGLFRTTPEIDGLIDPFYTGVIGPFWPPERATIDRGYRDLPFPLDELPLPDGGFAMTRDWTADEALGYLGTWSAVQRFAAHHGRDPLAGLAPALREAWGPGPRTVRWPLAARVGRFS